MLWRGVDKRDIRILEVATTVGGLGRHNAGGGAGGRSVGGGIGVCGWGVWEGGTFPGGVRVLGGECGCSLRLRLRGEELQFKSRLYI